MTAGFYDDSGQMRCHLAKKFRLDVGGIRIKAMIYVLLRQLVSCDRKYDSWLKGLGKFKIHPNIRHDYNDIVFTE